MQNLEDLKNLVPEETLLVARDSLNRVDSSSGDFWKGFYSGVEAIQQAVPAKNRDAAIVFAALLVAANEKIGS